MNINKYINPKAKLIDKYSLNDMKAIDVITIPDSISPQEIANLEYLPKNMKLIIIIILKKLWIKLKLFVKIITLESMSIVGNYLDKVIS